MSMSEKYKTTQQQLNDALVRISVLENIIHARDLEIDGLKEDMQFLKEQCDSTNGSVSVLLCMGKKILAQYNKILKQ